jgi:hypothetical protein
MQLFKARCLSSHGPEASVEIALDDLGADGYEKIAVRVGGAEAGAKSYELAQPVRVDPAAPVAFEVRLADAGAAAFAAHGMLGFTPGVGARLGAVRIVVRPAEREMGHSSEHPFFALYLDWLIQATVAADSEFAEGQVSGGATVELTLTTGFSCIQPPPEAWELGARALQLRIDLDFLAATTGWFPLPLVDIDADLPFAMPGLLAWFRRLVNLAAPDLPDWSLDFRLSTALPLGLRFGESHLALEKTDGGYVIDARARGLVAEWRGIPAFEHPDAEFSLRFDGGTYAFKAVLFAAQFPAADAEGAPEPRQIRLPFGALTLSAQACRVTAGLVVHGDPVKACPDLVIEIADVALSSELWREGQPLWRSDAVRLHLRGGSLLTCAVAGGKPLFEGLPSSNWLGLYRDERNPRVPRLSGAAGPDKATEDRFPITLLDGAVDPEGHLSLLWKQDNGALFDRLATLVPGVESKPAAAAGTTHYVALELARFEGPAGSDLQARLEWRKPDAEPILAAPSSSPPVVVGPAAAPQCSHPVGDTQVLNLPDGGDTPPAPIADPAIRLDLPLIEAAIAAPKARSLLFYEPAGEAATISLLHIYRKNGAAVQPILYAAVDLSLATGDERQLLPTAAEPENPFLSIGLASSAEAQALAVVSWREGGRPQIMRAFDGDGAPFAPLIPAIMPPDEAGDCKGCPKPPPPRRAPLALHPDRFGTPDIMAPNSGWTLAVQIAAERALRSFLPDGGSADSLVKISVKKIRYTPAAGGGQGFLPPLDVHAELRIRLGFGGVAPEVTGTAIFRFDPSDMSLRLVEGGILEFEMPLGRKPGWAHQLQFPEKPDSFDYSVSKDLFGLEATFYRAKPEQPTLPLSPGAPPPSKTFLTLDLRNGRFALGLAEGCACILRYKVGGDALTFAVEDFLLGPGGLDLEAALVPAPLKVTGLKNPFQLESARLSMSGSRLRRLTIAASGKLPEILAFTPVNVTLTLAQERAGGAIELEELNCWLVDDGEPIFTTGIRYRFEIVTLSLRYARDASSADGRHFFFEITGSAQFQPEPGEFDGGLLENLKSARIEFTRAPLSDEFTNHLTFIVELNEPVIFDVFNVFRMEIRSFGFAPLHDFEGGTPRPALIIGGQCEFADTGDVVTAEIDFHRMYIGLPAKDAWPQVDFKNLRVEIRTDEGFRIGGTLASYDNEKMKGFKGDGFVAIPGFPQIGAAFAFMELSRGDGNWKRAWFIALEASAISYQLAPLPIYLRHVGLGFGYRYTSVLLSQAPVGGTLQGLVDFLLEALNQHQTVARIESWIEDIDVRWSIAMEAVFTLGSAQPDPVTYRQKEEIKLRTIVLQTMAAMDSNGLVAGAKLWFPVSYDDFLIDKHQMRKKPLAKGFVHFAPRQQRLLAYARKEKNAYYGPPGDKLTEFAKMVLEPVPFECAALIEPGRVRGEIGWADRLVFQMPLGPLRVECRGGILYAVEKGAAVYGLYFSARGDLGLSGGAGGGSLGLRLSAQARVHFAARLMLAQPLLKPTGASVYGHIGLDINVRFSVEAWFKFKAGFVKVHLRLSFSLSIQVLVALEIGMSGAANLGFKARATVMISVFGRKLRASIAVGLNDSAVDQARDDLRQYMSSMLEPGKIPPVPGRADREAAEALAAPPLRGLAAPPLRGLASPAALATLGNELSEGRNIAEAAEVAEPFAFAVIPLRSSPDEANGDRHWLLWIMPTPAGDGFYPLPPNQASDWARLSNVPAGTKLFSLNSARQWSAPSGDLKLRCDPARTYKVESDDRGAADPDAALNLRKAIAGCYRPIIARADFPFSLPPTATQQDLQRVKADLACTDGNFLEDDRVLHGPRHAETVLDPENRFDAALLAAMERRAEDEADQRALGSQAFLLSGFEQDIQAYVAQTGANPPASPPRNPERPDVWDTGMVLLLSAPELPDWARSRQGEVKHRPNLVFEATSGAPHTLKPIVEPQAARLSDGNVQLTRKPVAHFDDRLLALSWNYKWRDDSPPAAAPGIGTRVEDFVAHYLITVYDLTGEAGNLGQRLLERAVAPATLLAHRLDALANAEPVELKTPYSWTIAVDEIFPERAADQSLRRVLVVVTPVGRSGEKADGFSIAATQALTLTPLPADQAELTLRRVGKDFVADLVWVEPLLPNRVTVAPTDQWELVLRRMPHVPLGHYPDAGAEAGDSSGALGSDRVVRPGDLILRMPKHALSGSGRVKNGPEGSRYTLSVPNDLRNANFTWHDHEGQALPEHANAPLQQLKASFLSRKSAAADGHAWRIFLRARHDPLAGEAGAVTYSSLVSVKLAARLKEPLAADSAGTAAKELPLPHLEWPIPLGSIFLAAPTVTAGTLHIPTAAFSRSPGGTVNAEIDYCPSSDERRVVSASWSAAVPAGPAAPAYALPAFAGFDMFETVESGLTNKDVAEREAARGRSPFARKIASFDAADPALAGAAPDSLLDTQNWESRGPENEFAGDRALADPGADAEQIASTWRRAGLLWPPPVESDAGSPVLAKANLHLLLVRMLDKLKADWADPQGFELIAAAGRPNVEVTSALEWMRRNTEGVDPNGWAALWHLGLAVELSARDRVSGRLVEQVELIRQCEVVLTELTSDTRFAPLARHVSLDCPLRPNAGYAAAPDRLPLADVALNRLQVSLRPIAERAATPRQALERAAIGRTIFLEYLGKAPLAPRPGSGQVDPADPPKPPMTAEEEREIKRLYPWWARRFFVGSPGPVEPADSFGFTNRNVAIAVPKTDAVAILAPGRDGSYRFNRLVTWQWATTRSLHVEGVGRYDRLLGAMGGADTLATQPRGTVAARPFHLHRIRRLQPPQLLGDRIVRADDGYDYHELTTAIHDEDSLQMANTALVHQLEFAGTRLRPRRSFRFAHWAAKLEKQKQVRAAWSSPALDWIAEPRFDATDETALAAIPAKRFGATVPIFRCQPYFYETTVELQALAVARESLIVERRLAHAEPEQPDPEGPEPFDTERLAVPWSGAIAERQKAWLAALGAAPPLLLAAMEDWQIVARVRFPRFFESARGRARIDEAQPKTIGMLPDCEASVHLSRPGAGAEEPICIIRPVLEGADLFAIVPLTPDLSVDLAEPDYANWDAGVQLVVALRPNLASHVEDGGEMPLAGTPLPGEQANSLFDPSKLPTWGPLAALAPLALRVAVEPTGEGELARLVARPFRASRAMLLPLSGDLTEDEPPRPGDVRRGLALLLDAERIAAGKAAAYRAAAAVPPSLAAAIEGSAGVACRKPPAADILETKWPGWRGGGLSFWALAPGDGGPGWIEQAELPGADVELLIAVAASWSPRVETALDDFLTLSLVADDAVQWDVEQIKTAAGLADRLAGTLEPQIERAWRLDPQAENITAWVQRGNAVRAPWGGRQS